MRERMPVIEWKDRVGNHRHIQEPLFSKICTFPVPTVVNRPRQMCNRTVGRELRELRAVTVKSPLNYH